MAPSSSCVSGQLRQLIYYHIDNNLAKNALFYAERLVAFDSRSSEAAYLLALCHLRLGDNASAYDYSKTAGSKGNHLGCAHVFAQAALALQRYKDGISSLEKCRHLWEKKNNFGKHTPTSRQLLPDAAAVYCLLGKLYYGYNDKNKAISCFEESLRLNPFMWDAFTSICDMGTQIRVANIFKTNPEMEAVMRLGTQEIWDSQPQSREPQLPTMPEERSRHSGRPTVASDAPDPFNNVPTRSFAGGLFGTLGISQKLNESNPSLTNLPAAGGGGIGPEAMETPTGPSAAIDSTAVRHLRDTNGRDHFPAAAYEAPQAPVRKTRAALGLDNGPEFLRTGRGITSKRSQKASEPAEELTSERIARNGNHAPMITERKRTVSGQVVPRQTSEDPGAPQRRSVRLFNQIRPTTKSSSNVATLGPAPGRELKKARPPISKIMRPASSISTVGRQVSGNRKPVEEAMDVDQRENMQRWPGTVTNLSSQRTGDLDQVKQEEALRFLLDLFKKFGNGYFALAQYQCLDAVHYFTSLPRGQQDTPWVLAQIGRAYYEQAAYAEAEKYYKRIRQMAPSRLEDMEIYSTILWHLKRESELAFLAHEMIDSTWKSAEGWCAVGNSWSLAREHEMALKCFKRATQLNNTFAYAFTLQGHEHVANEEYDKALISYRAGIAADNRHYNAWYGVGRVYEKIGNYEKAKFHYQTASKINPTNAVLICCIGTTLEKLKEPRQALAYFSKATDLAPRSALTRFKKARALMNLREHQAALNELNLLKDIAPDEAMVHFLLGKLYNKIKEKGQAIHYFTIALNLDPKASQQIKEAIEEMEDDDEDDHGGMTG